MNILKKHNLLALTVLSVALFAFLSVSSHSVFAEQRTNRVSASVASICSLTVTNNYLQRDVIPGTPTDMGTATFKAKCNDNGGIAVYAVGYTNNTIGNTDLSAGESQAQKIHTGAAASPTTSQWNMTIGAVQSDDENDDVTVVNNFDSQHVIPDVYTKVVSRNTRPDITTGANFTASFNVFADVTQLSGSYLGKVKFMLISPNVLSYDTTTGDPDTFASNTLGAVTVNYSAGVSSLTIGGKTVANGGEVALVPGQSYDIVATPSDGYEFDSWTATGGTLGSASSATTTFTVSSASNVGLTAAVTAAQNSEPEPSNEPQASPSAQPAQILSSPSYSQSNNIQSTNSGSTNTEDETSNVSSGETNTSPLGVRKSSDDSTSGKGITGSDNSQTIETIAIVSAATAAVTGIILLAKRRKDDEEEEE